MRHPVGKRARAHAWEVAAGLACRDLKEWVDETLRAGSALFAGSRCCAYPRDGSRPQGGRYAQIDAFGGLLQLRSPSRSPAVLPPEASCTQLLPSGSVFCSSTAFPVSTNHTSLWRLCLCPVHQPIATEWMQP